MWTTLLAAAWAADPPSDPRAAVALLGADRLDQVGELSFAFVVERGGEVKVNRRWSWRPADGSVTLRVGDAEPVTFTFGKPSTDAEKQADAQFVNDTFWLMPQLHLSWAGPADPIVTDGGEVARPIGDGAAHLVTLQYAAAGGGYTPGDAYDLYLDADGKIVAWAYWKGGKTGPAPSLVTTSEGYVQAGPLTLATEHHTADGSFRVSFADVGVTPR
ncbi:MAG: hypothetical protein ABMA64_42085 [Myxococcota bacterium]